MQTEQKKAMEWWNSLTLEEKFYKMIPNKEILGNDAARHPSALTGREIESLWIISNNLSENRVFEKGDVIDFYNERMCVIENNGKFGTCFHFEEARYVNDVFWYFDGENCKFVRKATEQELKKLGL